MEEKINYKHIMKKYLLILIFLLFNFSSIALVDNPPIRRLPGTTYNQYGNYSVVVVIHCQCWEEDLWVDDYMGAVRVVGTNDNDAKKNATNVCHELYGHRWTEFRLKECKSNVVNPNNVANNPVLGATHVLYSSSFISTIIMDSGSKIDLLEFKFKKDLLKVKPKN